jgi:tRNA A-37 threonylcarbamoyl transferase component Bud32
MASEADRLQPGSVVAEYRISHRIGGGGMGTVYAAEHPQIKKRVAIKVLRRELAHDIDSVKRFEREARAANEVSHPAIVDVFALGTLDDGRPYLVMSMLEGRSLGERIAEAGKLSPGEAWSIAREMADALAAAHDRGVIHRDLKPDNVFLEKVVADSAPRVRLLDLGLAKLLADATDPLANEAAPMKLTKTGIPVGTPLYMAPEQWWGGEVDARVDQYALGVTLYEMLAGSPPFVSPQFVELAQEHLHKDPPSLGERGASVTPSVEAFVRRLLAKSPDDRFASMGEVTAAGDAAFDAETAVAETALPAVADGRARARRRFLVMHAALVTLAPVALALVGYGGEHRHEWTDWWKSTGPPLPVILAGYVAGGGAVAWTVRRRVSSASLSVLPWILALGTATAAALGTHFGWQKVDTAIARLRAPQRFEIMHMGMFELTLARFIGFHLAAVLLVSMAAATLVTSAPSAAGRPGRFRHARDPILAAGLGLAAVVASVVGLPSVALVAATCAAVTGLPWLVAEGPAPSRDAAIERATAAVVACLLAFSVGVARVEAREAALWEEQPTRAARAAEIIAADQEQSLTLLFGGGLVVVLAAVEISRLAAALRGMPGRGLGRRVVALACAVLALIGADVALRVQFGRTRSALHEAVESQFALFANLEPPTASGLDASRYAPRDAPALQIARSSVAVDARPIAPLSAVAYAEGSADVGREISRALASRAAAGQSEARLAVSIDRQVPWRTAARLLGVARRAGALEVELLFTRGPALSLPEGSPPEASWVLGSDFVALPVLLEPGDVEPDASATYEEIAAEVIRRAGSGEQPIRLVVSGAP